MYRRIAIFALLTLLVPGFATAAQAQKPDDEVLKVVSSLFEGMRKKDTVMMRSTLAPNARLISTSTRDGTPVSREVAIESWMSGVARSTDVLDEKLFDPEVRVSDNLATVWVRYELWVGERFSHCGYDAFQLVRGAGGWKIVQIADTQASGPACGVGGLGWEVGARDGRREPATRRGGQR